MFTFYLYLAFIQTRNAKSLSKKHLRLTLLILILISLTSNYRLTYTTSQKFLNSKILVFKEFSSAHQACIYLIQNTAKTVTFWNIFYHLKFLFSIWKYFKVRVIPVISQLIFLASLLQSHDPSEIILMFWFAAQKTLIIMLKTAE